jgi:hypothetical protein
MMLSIKTTLVVEKIMSKLSHQLTQSKTQVAVQSQDTASAKFWFVALAFFFAGVFYFYGYYFWADLWRVLTG